MYTVLLANSELKAFGFEFVVSHNETRKPFAAFAGEAEAVAYAKKLNEHVKAEQPKPPKSIEFPK